jgi:hypothetical protein
MRRREFLSLVFTAITIAAWAMAFPSFAQGGSTGGSIGKQNKSVSGGESDAPAPRPLKKGVARHPDRPNKPPKSGCPSIVGAWNSWSSHIFGSGDAVMDADGTAKHASGITGRWHCDNGQLYIEWSDGKPGPVRVSADGKRVFNSSGGVHMSR